MPWLSIIGLVVQLILALINLFKKGRLSHAELKDAIARVRAAKQKAKSGDPADLDALKKEILG